MSIAECSVNPDWTSATPPFLSLGFLEDAGEDISLSDDLKRALMKLNSSVEEDDTVVSSSPDLSLTSDPQSCSFADLLAHARVSENGQQTTVIIRNTMNALTPWDILETLSASPLRHQVNFIYTPTDSLRRSNLGYAFMNFLCHSAALSFKGLFENFPSGKKFWKIEFSKVQGLECNVRYCRPALEFSDDNDAFHPLLIDPASGQPVRFIAPSAPPPTPVTAPSLESIFLPQSVPQCARIQAPRPGKPCNAVIVGNLGLHANEADILAALDAYDSALSLDVVDLAVARDPVTGLSRGFAVVEFRKRPNNKAILVDGLTIQRTGLHAFFKLYTAHAAQQFENDAETGCSVNINNNPYAGAAGHWHHMLSQGM